MNSYFFLTSTIMTETEVDPAIVICQKYSQGGIQIFYGVTVAICAIQCETEPDITEIVQMKSRIQVINLVHPNLPNFNGAKFIEDWEQRTL